LAELTCAARRRCATSMASEEGLHHEGC
jgi:hypothetical protein